VERVPVCSAPVVAPQLTKLPTSLDVSYRLAGTYNGYVNQSTGARLAAPQNLPLSIDRNLKAVSAQSTSSELVVKGASAMTIGPDKSAQVMQYVLDRSTAKNVNSPDAMHWFPATWWTGPAVTVSGRAPYQCPVIILSGWPVRIAARRPGSYRAVPASIIASWV
jgi:hypothetical protein